MLRNRIMENIVRSSKKYQMIKIYRELLKRNKNSNPRHHPSNPVSKFAVQDTLIKEAL